MKIHPTAIIESGARLAENVTIGPYTLIGPDVEIGEGCIVESHAVLQGAVKIGVNSFIGHGAVIGTDPQDLSFKSETASGVVIGDRNIIREYCTIHRGAVPDSNTVVGDDNFLMAGVHMGHNSRIGNNVIAANSCLLAGYVDVDDGAFLGGAGLFHQHVRIGRLAITQGGARCNKDVPPFVIAAGLNAAFGLNTVGLRRAGFTPEERDEIKRAFRLLYLSGLNVTQALEKSRREDWSGPGREFMQFVAKASKRGICAYAKPA